MTHTRSSESTNQPEPRYCTFSRPTARLDVRHTRLWYHSSLVARCQRWQSPKQTVTASIAYCTSSGACLKLFKHPAKLSETGRNVAKIRVCPQNSLLAWSYRGITVRGGRSERNQQVGLGKAAEHVRVCMHACVGRSHGRENHFRLAIVQDSQKTSSVPCRGGAVTYVERIATMESVLQWDALCRDATQ